jgi:3',5'-cyclic-AMP phosphodiesterase
MNPKHPRRQALKKIGLSAASLLAIPSASQAADQSKANPILRIAHLTDMHVQPGGTSEAGVRKCLDQILTNEQPIDFFINGGDLIMDALGEDKEATEAQWAVWRAIKKDYSHLKFYHCIGNHDVWGKSPDLETYPGKAWALREHGLDKPYYTFSEKGWHFIVLDSTHPKPDNTWYTAKLDTTQRNWLEQILLEIPSNEPVLIVSHIPILGATPFLDGDNASTGDWIVPGAWMHTDAKSLIQLFYSHKNVKVCLSGHIHLVESLIYHDVSYHCSGAVCGNWWNNEPYELTERGYAILELFADGTHSFAFNTF